MFKAMLPFLAIQVRSHLSQYEAMTLYNVQSEEAANFYCEY